MNNQADVQIEEATIAGLQSLMGSQRVTALDLVEMYMARIEQLDRQGPELHSILEVNPQAEDIARALDDERLERGPRGPLHGIPILLKDNIATADHMATTAGSLALAACRPKRDATVASRLRASGAVILGKTNLSEWMNFRSTHSSSGWSGRGGQCRNPYALDRTPWGSSSGSGTAVAANLAAASLGTETDGSIVLPAAVNCLAGIKPTVGLVGRSGVIPISKSQDAIGPMARTVTDVAVLLGAIVGPDPDDNATASAAGKFFADYTRFLNSDGLRGSRIGVPRQTYFGYSEKADSVIDDAIGVLRDLGATVIDPADISTAKDLTFLGSELEVLLYEFKDGVNGYLAGLDQESPIRTLEDVITFNRSHASEEMPYFKQELLEMSQAKGPLTEREYIQALEHSRTLSRQGIDEVMDMHHLDALVMPTTSPPCKIDLVNGDHIQGTGSSPAAQAGYPVISVPAGYTFGLPIGLLFTGRPFSEPALIRMAYAFEQATQIRRVPTFPSSVP